jgi:hypothetical protein
MGNDHFTWFGTTASKSRLNFLELLRAGYGDYVINAAALTYMRERALAAYVVARLAEHPDRYFANQEAWNAHLEKLGIAALRVNPDPVLIATEGALWGSVKAHGFRSRGKSRGGGMIYDSQEVASRIHSGHVAAHRY